MFDFDKVIAVSVDVIFGQERMSDFKVNVCSDEDSEQVRCGSVDKRDCRQ